MPKILEMALVYWSLSKWLTGIVARVERRVGGLDLECCSFTRAVFIVVRKLPSVGGHSKQAP